MNGLGATTDIERFRNAVARHVGLHFDDGKLGLLGEVLQRRLDAVGRTAASYLGCLTDDPAAAEFAALAPGLTVGETYFFRNIEQFRALQEIVLPRRMETARTGKTLHLLSAGCATGEEAYSLAIMAREAIVDPTWRIEIRAVDLNPVSLAKAACAHYSSWALRGAPADLVRRWFRAEARKMVLDEAARDGVTFETRNLADDDPDLWRLNGYDVIFCRNVMMYFTPGQARALTARMARALAPGGFLFLGHAETLRGLSDAFHLHHSHDTFYYERKDGSSRASQTPAPVAPAAIPPGLWPIPSSNAWIESIGAACERVAALVPAPTMVDPTAPPSPIWTLAQGLDLLREERFAEALAHVQNVPSQDNADPEILLLAAILFAHGGQVAAAEDACLRLLSVDRLNAGARYTMALCREAAGDDAAAVEHDRLAAHLDPAFAMPRLHLGLLARRAGQRETARRELGQALVLLAREEASRLLLFGGGFNREALIALCQSALSDCRGSP
jgi:chemotaxis protein methyltransferase CheR